MGQEPPSVVDLMYSQITVTKAFYPRIHFGYGGSTVRRHRKTGLTEQQKDDILHYDNLTEGAREDLKYNVRAVIDKELEDLEWLFSEVPEAFRRMRYRNFEFPIDAVVPGKRAILVDKVSSWMKVLENIRAMVMTWEFRLYKGQG